MKSITVLVLGLSLVSTAAFAAGPSLVCKKRTRQVYSAFYRAEVLTRADGSLQFEYGVGDQSQIYELYFIAPVIKTSESTYETPDGANPHVLVELKTKRGKKSLEFAVTALGGKADRRTGYACE